MEKTDFLKLPESEKFRIAYSNSKLSIQRELVEDKNQRVLFALAKSTSYNEIIERLLEVGDTFVLLKLIENPHTPLEIIEKLSKHRLMVVSFEANKKLNTSSKV